jgi:DNA-binding NarL/FixJ family response regulator
MEEKFTERELQIINLLALGHNNGEIAEQLLISKHTVHTHRKNIYKKGNFKKIRDVVLFSLFFSKPLPA